MFSGIWVHCSDLREIGASCWTIPVYSDFADLAR
jgi:hypothetical protein